MMHVCRRHRETEALLFFAFSEVVTNAQSPAGQNNGSCRRFIDNLKTLEVEAVVEYRLLY